MKKFNGQLIRKIRNEKGLIGKDYYDYWGRSDKNRNLYALETKGYKNPRILELQKIAEWLGVEVSDFFEEKSENN